MRLASLALASTCAFVAALAFAQTPPAATTPAQGPTPGQVMGPGMGPGNGMGPGRGMGMRFDAGNTAGWTLMTAEERQAHRAKMASFKTVEECRTYQTEHIAQMQQRAADKKVQLRGPRHDMCTMMFPAK